MKKKILSILLITVLVFSVTACGSSEGSGTSSSKKISASDLSIKDFAWETNQTECGYEDCYALSLTNNSKYDIIGVDFTYKVKKGVSDSDLSVYDEFMQEHEDYIDEDDTAEDVTLHGDKNVLVKKGEKLTDLRFTVGYGNYSWYDYPTEEQFELMEPDEMEVGLVSGNKLYIATYDFGKKSWKLDDDTFVVDTMSKKDAAKQLSKPVGEHFVVRTDKDDDFSLYSYGVTEEMYNQYVETLKSAGFEEENYSSRNFEGTNSEGYTVEVWFDNDEESITVSIEK